MRVVLWTAAAFFSASIMYSYLIGRAVGIDIRHVGDGNPGAGNLTVAGHLWLGVLGAALDFAKAAVPVGWAAVVFGPTSWALVPIGIAPIAGHAFSPWFRFRGGKSLACTFGTWAGVAGVIGVLPLGLGIAATQWLVPLDSDAWSIMCGMGCLLAALVVAEPPPMLALWTLNMLVLGLRYRSDLAHRPRPHLLLARPWR